MRKKNSGLSNSSFLVEDSREGSWTASLAKDSMRVKSSSGMSIFGGIFEKKKESIK